ncbi:efflux RND transporter permease subunit [Zavarzinia sp. CC-PAN008]|uniref:efflux RND transporter permease subunit n=1 Tax=Zavarzinia sp. CC-PAN008 TaxID=3243332 RepID=UPI003F74A24B
MAKFFIARPIFAIVIAIIIMLAGATSIFSLPVSQYPDIAPPTVTISASYPGASAATLENSVTKVIEQQLKGIDGLLYFSSTSQSSGQASITVTLEQGTDPDIAQVQVQNKVQQALNRLPQAVQALGVTVAKSQSDFLMIVGLYDETDRATNIDISDFMISNLVDPLSRLEGVGDVTVFGAQYAMRIWLDPGKLNSFGLMPSDVTSAIQAQNTQVSAGEVGARPALPGQMLNATVTALSRLQTAEEFENIILRSDTSGATVRLRDVARVELGAENYGTTSRFNGHPSAGIAVQLASGANALSVADLVKARVAELEPTFPEGYVVAYPIDSTEFVRISIEEVIKTLVEAIFLVLIVMFVFLQNWRVTIIPMIAVPVVLLGTFGILSALGFSINTLTLFAMVLAIGLLVDDAIVVVENVERIMREEGLPPREATIKSMEEITPALVGIVLVLTAVFLPMAFFGGSVGVIYRQFSVTIVSAMALSLLVAIVLTPALCATILRPVHIDPATQRGFFGWFNRWFGRTQQRYGRGVGFVARRPVTFMALFVVVIGLLAVMFTRMPTSFLPDEDQGQAFVVYTLPSGATTARTQTMAMKVQEYFAEHEPHNVKGVFTLAGFSFNGSGQNAGMAFLTMHNWDDRPGAENSAQAIANRAMAHFSQERDAQVFALVPPSVRALGRSAGFEMWLQDPQASGHAALMQARNQVLGGAAKEPSVMAVRPNGLEDTAQLHIEIDQAKAGVLGLSQADINSTLSTAWGGTYVNDFIDRGRVKRVYVQGDAPFRSAPEDLNQWYVRGSTGAMTPFSAFTTSEWTYGSPQLQRFNGLAAVQIQGAPAPGQSTGAAMDTMQRLVDGVEGDYSLAWSGISFQERLSSGQAPILYALSILVIFLCLAALYESWSIPLSVLLVIPLGVIGAVLAATARGLTNDIFFQVGLLTTIGLSSKNAILIVEFAEAGVKRGMTAFDAAVEGAVLRLRPILMTSLAFTAGILPLALATGAGAASQNDIGTGVIGGVLTGTFFGIFMVPLFFVLVHRLFGQRHPEPVAAPQPAE